MWRSLRAHWPEYVMEGAELAIFMILAGGFATLYFAEASPIAKGLPNALCQRLVMGLTMGCCAIAIIYSPWGKRSGAHFNPAVTLAFYRLGKLTPWDGAFYILAQFLGGTVGIAIATLLFGDPFTHLPVHYIITVPGVAGWPAAVLAEAIMAFGLMGMVLLVSNHPKLHPFTGWFAGGMVALFVLFAAPISGTSLNPARTFASGLAAQVWTAFWIYALVPPLAMLAAAELYQRGFRAAPRAICGKLCPNSDTPCPFIDCPCGAPPSR